MTIYLDVMRIGVAWISIATSYLYYTTAPVLYVWMTPLRRMYYVLRICEQDKENVGVTCAEEDGLSVDDDE